MSDICYYIWLQKIFMGEPEKAHHILSLVKSPETFYKHREELVSEFSFLDDSDKKKIKSVSLKSAEAAEKRCRLKNIEIITPESKFYPERFKEIPNPPFLIYAFGNLDLLNGYPIVSVVGTRKSDREADMAAMHFSYDLASVGAVICSGVAEGIDAAAIKGALRAEGKTIGIMACSLDVNYPAATGNTKREILKADGLLISEYPPTERAFASNFYPRNRLMSGISDAVLAVKAPQKSGTLITASHAAEQGRELYVIPWSPYERLAEGSNKLISDGAYPVFSSQEIFLPLSVKYPEKIDVSKYDKNSVNIFRFSKVKKKENVSKKQIEDDPILSLLLENDLSFDELVIKTKMSASSLSSQLIKLEMKGYTERDISGKYTLKI